MSTFKHLVILSIILTGSGCSTISIDESKASKSIYQSAKTNWNGLLINTYDGESREFSANIKSMKVDFIEGENKYHNTSIFIDAAIESKDPAYGLKGTIRSEIAARVQINKRTNHLELSDFYVKNLDIEDVYKAYSADIKNSLVSAMSDYANIELPKGSLGNLEDFLKSDSESASIKVMQNKVVIQK